MGSPKVLVHQQAPPFSLRELDDVEHAAQTVLALLHQQMQEERFGEQLIALLCSLRCHTPDGAATSAALHSVDKLQLRIEELEEDVRRRDVRIGQYQVDAQSALKESHRLREVMQLNVRLYQEVQYLRSQLHELRRQTQKKQKSKKK